MLLVVSKYKNILKIHLKCIMVYLYVQTLKSAENKDFTNPKKQCKMVL